MRSGKRTDGRRTPWRVPALAATVSALGVAAAVLVPAALSEPAEGRATRSAAAPAPERAANPAPAARPSADGPAREKCEDGSDPVESLKPSGDSGPAVKRIKEEGRLVVGVDQSSYLWGFREPATGDFAGFDIDLVEAIGEDLLGPDPHITFKTVPTDRRVEAIRNGEVDMVVRTMTVNCDRGDEVAFSTAYFEAGQQLVVPEAGPDAGARITGLDGSMRDRRLCVAESSTAQTLMERKEYKALGARMLVVDNQLDCLVQMQLGRTEATLTDSALGAGQAAQDPSVELVGKPETTESYGVAMNLEDEDLVRRVNKVLEDYRDDGWRESYEKWLEGHIMGTEDDGSPDPPKARYRD